MKKILFLALLGLTGQVNAQSFAEGTNVVSLGLGLGGTFGSYTYSSQTPGISLQYEHGQWPVGGPGVISIGGYAGVKSYKYDQHYGQYNYNQKWSYTVLGVRSAYHYTGFDIKELDVYGGAMLSYNILTYKYSDNDPFDNAAFRGNYGSAVGLTLYIGGRYYFTDNVGAFLELGYGVSYATIGVAFKL